MAKTPPASKKTKNRKWNDANLPVIYTMARDGRTDEEIADHFDVPLHVIRRWVRTNEPLRVLLSVVRSTDTPATQPPADSNRNSEDELVAVYREFSHLKPPMKKRLLVCYAQTGILTHAAKAAGTSRENHYRWLNEDKEYAEFFARLQPLTVGKLEDKALSHAIDGMRRYKFTQNGRPQMIPCERDHPEAVPWVDANGNERWSRHYYEDEYSPSLQIFMLKCLMPDKYRDRPIEVNAQVSVGFDMNEVLKRVEDSNVVDVEHVEARAVQLIQETKK